MNEKRTDRLSSAVQKAVSDIIQFKVKSKHIGYVTVTAAEVTNDLSYAFIYVSFIQDAYHEQLEALEKIKGFIRTELAKEVKMRKVPQIVFKVDESTKNYRHVEKLLNQVKKEKE